MAQGGSSFPVSGASAESTGLGSRGWALVLVAGLVTTALALLGVFWLDNNTDDFHVMGWYGDYVIPAGALLVGAAAGSGYGIASYLTGFKIRRGLLLAVLALQLGGYAAAQYLEFQSYTQGRTVVDDDGEELTFPRYYHLRAINFAWDNHGKPGSPLGLWGYFFLGLGVLGFVSGGVLAPALLMKMPYCDRCQLYMKSRALALIPASASARRVSKEDVSGQAALQDEARRASETATTTLARVTDLATRNDGLAITAALAAFPARGPEAKRANKLPIRVQLRFVHCRVCASGYLQPETITGRGRAMRVQPHGRLPLSPDAIRSIAGN